VTYQQLPRSTPPRTGLYHVRLYGRTRDELCYTPFGVDPKEIYGENFPGETFRTQYEVLHVYLVFCLRGCRCRSLLAQFGNIIYNQQITKQPVDARKQGAGIFQALVHLS